MDDTDRSTTARQTMPDFDNIRDALRQTKLQQGKTNQDIADGTGLPLSYVGKFFSGRAASANVCSVAAICAYLDVSMDELFQLRRIGTEAELSQEIEYMNLELEHKEETMQIMQGQVDLLKESSRIMARGLQQKEDAILAANRNWRPLTYGLCGMCSLLTIFLMTYIILDYQHPKIGLIRADGVSPIVYISACGIAFAILFIGRTMVKRRLQRKEKGRKAGHEHNSH